MTEARSIVPFHEWYKTVMWIHAVLHDQIRGSGMSYWWRAYRNNESPYIAYMGNYGWTLDSQLVMGKLIASQHKPEIGFNMAPYSGIGDENPYREFEP